ncbi:tannase/feruloyl esterase family alpha/beta hydrolase [Bisgaard Taxon 10/6]|uniref:tannase/feruloyl esterase family alpha/beta hydrolase n=1 Tax=Exercitatus varius TaxID=67857 RepID=UPI00294B7BAD|nr:tannase/feruloyl esterase family alpha/beta hydrolase [Exercitatus varius]MDG2916872.1 tannase/feruloyl esterase family alpha/beta hydrolase [Exercitatus varius]
MKKSTALSGFVALVVAAQNGMAQTEQNQCLALKDVVIPNTQITAVKWFAGGVLPQDEQSSFTGASESQTKAEAHCVVNGEIEKYQGADGKPYAIGFQLRLPQNWNKKFLFQGGGGLDGFVAPAVGAVPVRGSNAVPALMRGYAVATMDGGHQGARDTAFTADQQARLNYAYAATGKVTATAKRLIEQMYQTQPEHSYFMGCSNGGREAMNAAMRYPLEFDGVVAGNPGFRLSRAAMGEAWDNQQFMKFAPTNEKGEKIVANALTQADLDAVAKGVLARCDAKDGLEDGIINAWEHCDFKPEMVKKEIGAQKVALLNAIFNGAKNSRGENVYSSWPYDAGINTQGWRQWKHGDSQTAQPNSRNFTMGVASLKEYFMTPRNPDFDTLKFDFDKDPAKVAQISGINDADKTDLSTFRSRGGKMIIFEGVSDPVFSAHDLRDWYRQLQADMQATEQFARVFMIPGMNHCGGGPAFEDIDPLTALEQWVENGNAPAYLVGKAGKALPDKNKTMPICAYPHVATYKGGDVSKADSFECR